jgi:hypothetical protein
MAKKVTKKPQTKGLTAKKPTAKAKPTTAKQTKRPTAKKATPKKTVAKKTTAKTPGITAIGRTIAKATPSTRRPSPNPPMPDKVLESILTDLARVKADLEDYAANLRPLDRKRLNNIGLKKEGFTKRAYELALENPEFLPKFLSIEKLQEDYDYFNAVRMLFDINKQVGEFLWNILLQAADIFFTDTLEFYVIVREAAKRRIDPAETIYKELEIFFKRKKGSGELTEKEFIRDARAYYHGKKDGKLAVENIRPKLTGGLHKVIDERFMDNAKFKESEDGEITE